MKDWLHCERSLQPRPVIFIEDHVSHVFELCAALADHETLPGEVLENCTIVLLDVPGPDTEFEALRLLLTYPSLQVLAGPFETPLQPCLRALESGQHGALQRFDAAELRALLSSHSTHISRALAGRYCDLTPRALQDESAFTRLLDQLLRPGGQIICDIELLPLPFTHGTASALYGAVRAASVACRNQAEPNGANTQQPAQLLIVSNREKFGARIDKALIESGVCVSRDDIFRKSDDLPEVIHRIRNALHERFPWRLRMRHLRNGELVTHNVGKLDKTLLDSVLDVVIWPLQDGVHQLSGQAVLDIKSVAESSGRASVLMMLAEAHLKPGCHAVTYHDICAKLESLAEKQSPSQVIEGILRMLQPQQQRRIIPKGSNYAYRLGDDAHLALISAP